MDKSFSQSLDDTSLSPQKQFWRSEDYKQTIGSRSTDESELRSLYRRSLNSLPQSPELEMPSLRHSQSFSHEQSLTSFMSQQKPIKKNMGPRQYSILICTDFSFPKFGGVETHGYQLAQCLIERGHKVCFVTNKFQNDRCGVRYMANGLKVYHLPQVPVCQGDVAFLSVFNCLPLVRQILIREQVDIVHGHQSTSIIQHCVLMAAKSFGLKTVFTEHSLFGYNDFSGIHINKLVKWTFRDLDAAICVSNACKDNFVLRAKFDPRKTFTIPNAVDFNRFTPDVTLREQELAKSGKPEQINIVYISRLQYRKGIDLLIPIIPKILAQFENVHFIIGGDGPGMGVLQELVEKHNLHGRVELLGGLPHDKVRDVLCRGHIFLNTSLTESFCIAILEAACCGLLVVSTDVGGVPEVLPPHMAYLSKPEEKSIIRQLCRAVNNVKSVPVNTFHKKLSDIYSWRQVAERTEKVYDQCMETPVPNMLDRIKTSYMWGSVVGTWAVLYCIFESIILMLTEYFLPEQDIDVVQSFNSTEYNTDMKAYGDHELYVDNKDKRQNKQMQETIIDQQFVRRSNHFSRNNRYSTVQPVDQIAAVPAKFEVVVEEEPVNTCQCCAEKMSMSKQISELSTQTFESFISCMPPLVRNTTEPTLPEEIIIEDKHFDVMLQTTTPEKKAKADSSSTPDTVDDSEESQAASGEKREAGIEIESAPNVKHFLSCDSEMQVE